MGFKEFQVNLDHTSDATFRAWVNALLQGWADAGWVRTADTGQINPASAVKPAAVNTSAGYAMFRFDDALQSTAPIYFKVEFGTGAHATQPAMWLTVGKATNGAGSLTSAIFPRSLLGLSVGYAFTPNGSFANLASSGPGYVGFLPSVDDPATGTNAGTKSQSFIIERSRSADGSPSAAGLMVAHDSPLLARTMIDANYRPSVRAINYTDGSYTEGLPPVSIPYSVNGATLGPGTSLAAGSIGPVFPWVLIAPGLAPWQSCVMLCIPTGDYPSGVFETTLCSERAPFRAVPASVIHTWGVTLRPREAASSASGYIGPAMRWQ